MSKFVSANDNEAIQEQLYDHNCLCQGSVMFRRECRESVGLYDETLELSEDYDFWLRMTEITRVVKLPAVLYQYRDHDSSVTHRHYGQQLLRKAFGLDKALARRFGAEPPDTLVTMAARDYLEAAVHLNSSGDIAGLRQSLAGVLRRRPEWFESETIHIPSQPRRQANNWPGPYLPKSLLGWSAGAAWTVFWRASICAKYSWARRPATGPRPVCTLPPACAITRPGS